MGEKRLVYLFQAAQILISIKAEPRLPNTAILALHGLLSTASPAQLPLM